MPTNTTRSATTKSPANATATTTPTPNFPNRSLFVGDNLYALRGINSGCVDLIYLDPPFNSNRTYNAPHGSRAQGAAFKDTWTLDDWDAALEQELEIADKGAYHTINAAGEHHGDGMRSYLGYMYVRLAEMHRILKPDGSLYLHCDDTASHYLKILLDTLFGAGKFRNEITWKRQSAHNDSKAFGRVSDTILFYGDSINSDAVRVALDSEYVDKTYRHKDERGVYAADNITAKGLSGGGYMYDFHGHPGPWRYPESRMLELEAGRAHPSAQEGWRRSPDCAATCTKARGRCRARFGRTYRRCRAKSAPATPRRSRLRCWSASSWRRPSRAIWCLTRSAAAPQPASPPKSWGANGRA